MAAPDRTPVNPKGMKPPWPRSFFNGSKSDTLGDKRGWPGFNENCGWRTYYFVILSPVIIVVSHTNEYRLIWKHCDIIMTGKERWKEGEKGRRGEGEID